MGVIAQAIKRNRLARILDGWKNYVFENAEVEAMAKDRAKECAGCNDAIPGTFAQLIEDEMKEVEGLVCNGCGAVKCPLSTKLRSVEETCPKGNWK